MAITEQNANVNKTVFPEGFTGADLKNADVNLTKYGDDSSMQNYDEPHEWGGQNDKYVGEGTKNTTVAYNPDLKISDLDPDYKYGGEAQKANTENAGYITSRNDNIASALYNEGKTSMQDVSDFLYTQQGFTNSNENERQNTIYSVWKRLGQVGDENKNKSDENAEVDNNPSNPNNDALNNMQNDLNQDRSNTLYGKVTGDENGGTGAIETLEDKNSVYERMNQSRINNFNRLQGLDSQDIATSIYMGTTPYGTQAMRDLMQYNPAKYQEVQKALKALQGTATANSIANGTFDTKTTAEIDKENIDNDINSFGEANADESTSSGDIISSVKEDLKSNDTASTAQEQMGNLEADMVKLKERLKNLPKEAKKAFKSDVPQYLVNAYIANRTQEINAELSNLEQRYNMAYTRYKDEVAQAQWNAEYSLKQQQLQLQMQNQAFNQWMSKQELQLSQDKYNFDVTKRETENGFGNYAGGVPLSTMARSDIESIVDGLIASCEGGELSKSQCAAGVKNNYLSKIGVELTSMSSLKDKKSIINREGADVQPSKGDVMVLDLNHKSKDGVNYGHMAIVTSVDEDGTIHVLDWNGDLDGNGVGTETASTEHTYKIGDKRIQGYYDPTYGGQSSNMTNWTRRDGETFDLTSSPTYNSIPDNQKRLVEGLLNLGTNPDSITKNKYGEKGAANIKAAVLEINPLWTENDFKERVKVKQEWNTSSKNGSNSRNGTAAATAMDIYNMADKLGNGSWKDWNALMNGLKKTFNDTDYVKFRVNMQTLASEYAGALKGGTAAPTEQEINDAKQLIADTLSSGNIKAAAKEMAKTLYNKNANEAENYRHAVLEKPNLIVTQEVADWMADIVGLDMGIYQYTPGQGVKTSSGGNKYSNPSFTGNAGTGAGSVFTGTSADWLNP